MEKGRKVGISQPPGTTDNDDDIVETPSRQSSQPETDVVIEDLESALDDIDKMDR